MARESASGRVPWRQLRRSAKPVTASGVGPASGFSIAGLQSRQTTERRRRPSAHLLGVEELLARHENRSSRGEVAAAECAWAGDPGGLNHPAGVSPPSVDRSLGNKAESSRSLVRSYTMHLVDVSKVAALAADIAPAAALFGAAVFFGYKLCIGYLIVNASVALTVTRARGREGHDFLGVTACLRKGEHGSISLHHISGNVLWAGGETELVFEGYERLSYKIVESQARILLHVKSTKSPLLNLSPGEEATFATTSEVPAGVPCIVYVTALGQLRRGSRYAQWRASAPSLPLTEQRFQVGSY